jgi:sulfite reductase (NADPH) flavoprotein alpha-component
VSLLRRLTPLDYDRNIFHIEMDIRGTGLTYEIGSALGVHGCNDSSEVLALLALLGLEPEQLVAVPLGQQRVLQSAFRLFSQDLDVFGKVGKEFYEALSRHASAPEEAALLRLLASDGGYDEFTARAEECFTFADVLAEFSSARPPVEALVAMLPRIKPRHYSIASSMKACPGSVHLLVVEVEWRTPKGVLKHGQCSRYLAAAKPGQSIVVSVMSSEMHLPADHAAPVMMAGLGTGMAPFRAFIQERCALA